MFSSARYVSGYYDERAVDLFFSEVKLAPTPIGAPTGALFSKDLVDPGSEEKIRPLTPNAEHGAFVMVLSSNAGAVTNAIGQFAENQVVADAITNIVNKNAISKSKAGHTDPGFTTAQAGAFASEIDALFSQLDTSATPDKDATTATYLRILGAIARANGQMISFSDFDSANEWFGGERR